jgi:hypothetical protein
MKKLLLLSALLFLFTTSKSQNLNCANFCVLNIAIDTVQDELNVKIYNGDSNFINYPIVVVTDALGDTVGNINNQFYFFGQNSGDTVIHVIPTTLDSLPSGFTGSVYLTDGLWDTTCMFSYPMTCSVGIHELAYSNSISVYPNPATDNFTVESNKLQNSNAVISIYDVTGKLIRSYSTSNNKLIINREGLESGLYFISIVSEEKMLRSKVVMK